MKAVSIKCPECNAELLIKNPRELCFCEYCGAKILLVNENEQVYRHIDEARLKMAEIALKQLQLEEQRRKENERSNRIKARISIVIIGLGIIFMLLGSLISVELMLFGLTLFVILIPMWFWKDIIGEDKNEEKKKDENSFFDKFKL